jgi:hypothetical protein
MTPSRLTARIKECSNVYLSTKDACHPCRRRARCCDLHDNFSKGAGIDKAAVSARANVAFGWDSGFGDSGVPQSSWAAVHSNEELGYGRMGKPNRDDPACRPRRTWTGSCRSWAYR